jgi:cyclopropane fatty-acyl-phospholipid synthase-like methyltransferase
VPATQHSEDPTRQFYERYYAAVADSQANALYCERLFGRNLSQHGFAEISHLKHLIQVTGIKAGSRVLDMGCGNGMICEYIADISGASVTGIDFIAEAIRQAEQRARSEAYKLRFQVMDLARMDFPPASFDVLLAIDTLYFTDLKSTLTQMIKILAPGGCMGIFYDQSWQPWTPLEDFPIESIHPDRTELADVLRDLDIPYRTWDYTAADLDHARRKKEIALALREQFAQEGNEFLYENHLAEAEGVMKAFAAGAHARYLYLATPGRPG